MIKAPMLFNGMWIVRACWICNVQQHRTLSVNFAPIFLVKTAQDSVPRILSEFAYESSAELCPRISLRFCTRNQRRTLCAKVAPLLLMKTAQDSVREVRSDFAYEKSTGHCPRNLLRLGLWKQHRKKPCVSPFFLKIMDTFFKNLKKVILKKTIQFAN